MDALSIALLAWGVSAALEVARVFVDVCRDTYNMDAVSLEREIKRVIAEGKRILKVAVAGVFCREDVRKLYSVGFAKAFSRMEFAGNNSF